MEAIGMQKEERERAGLRQTEDITLLYGIAEKSCFEITPDEFKKAAFTAFERAKEAAFTRGLPVIYGENGLVISEYANCKRFVRENGKDIRPYHGRLS